MFIRLSMVTDSSLSSAEGRQPAAAECFHCSLPVPEGSLFGATLLGEPRDFCCAGCLAVAETICEGGLHDYYRLRTVPGAALRAEEGHGRLFDREELQAAFVRRVGPHREVRLVLEGIRCDACLWLNERRLRSVPGVVEATVGYGDHSARVRWDPTRVELSTILRAVEEIGYRARPVDPSHRVGVEAEASRRDTARLVFAGVLGMMVMNLAIAAYLAGGPDASGRLALWETFARWGELLGAAALLAYPGQDFFVGAWRDLSRRRAGMDVPIALGLTATWIGGAWATLRGSGAVYFDAIAMLVFFVLLARAFQTRARLAAASALDRLAIVQPEMARRVDAGGGESEVPALDLCAGDIVRIRPGEAAPADGVLLDRGSSFDEAILTGEPWPRRREPGDDVAAGSCNRDQPVLLRVTRAGEASTVGEIRRLLERGLAARPRLADMADRLAGWLVGAVLLCAAATAVFWAARDPARALPATVAVLIVTCPCALALASPIALALAAARLAKIGVLPARMAGIEALALADTAVFDKTGTLTMAVPVLEGVDAVGLDRETALSIAAALESHSTHPIAEALRRAPVGQHRDSQATTDHAGEGIEGDVAGSRWWVGSPGFVFSDGGAPPELAHALGSCRARGRLAAVLSDRRGRAALFTFAEELRPGARAIAGTLRDAGLPRTVLLSGDAPESARRFAEALGLDEGIGAMSAASKLDWIRARRDAGARVLFVGDGWNDAPTLAAADASVSFAEAPQLSRLAADFVILRRDLLSLAAARRIARRARRLMRQNVAWALAYNILIVPLAAAGLLAPWIAALAMSASSLAVVANALRLARPLPGEEPAGEDPAGDAPSAVGLSAGSAGRA